MNPEDYRLFLGIKPQLLLLNCDEPEDFLYRTHGDIQVFDEDDHGQTIGRFSIFQVDIEAGVEAGLPLAEVLDGTQETEVFSLLFDGDSQEFTSTISKLCGGELMLRNLLIIDRIEILPPFRGHGFGREILRGILRRFKSNASLAALKVFPLQFVPRAPGIDSLGDAWRQEMGLDAFSRDEAKATKALKSFYRKCGFQHVPRTPLMIANLEGVLP